MNNRIYVVRHGMRIDHEDKSWKKTAARPFDPPLSDRGQTQAARTGRYLQQFAADISAVYASPLVRTVQTAAHLSRALEKPVWLEEGLIEWLNPAWYDFSAGLLPLEELRADCATIDADYRPLVTPRYPEHDEAICRARFEFTARQLGRTAEGDIVLVTHGVGVTSILTALTGRSSGFSTKTCAVNILAHGRKDEWRLIESHTEHLTTQEKKVQFI